MTHDELTIRIIKLSEANDENWKFYPALRAVVELHKAVNYTKEVYPDRTDLRDVLFCPSCSVGNVTYYPCPTIEAIEKEVA